MSYLLWRLLPQAARQGKRRFNRPTYSHFIYDRGIPLWAGGIVTWLFPRLGGTPILRGKADRLGLRAARHLFAHSPYPIAVAPEGGTNEHNEIVSPLEPGVSQLGFWCAEDLHKAKRTASVYILPIGIQYRYVSPPWTALTNLIQDLETDLGLAVNAEPLPGLLKDPQADQLYGRVLRVAEKLLTDMESFYSRYYHLTHTEHSEANPVAAIQTAETASWPAKNLQLAARLRVQLNNALQVAEQYFGCILRANLSIAVVV
ncbi:MAG: hypothetical protein HC792_04010 [Acaryochloridaceae cyanobacterium CSU_5_19]|nr:hypothetical protein [Acaryochloridaceae cyanobacterium CSU_5_19]